MEEKKFDPNSLIGFVLIFGILLWIMYQNKPDEAQIAAEKAQKELVAKEELKAQEVAKTITMAAATTVSDTLQLAQLQKSLGSFAYSATLPSAQGGITTLENNLVTLKIANKGGYIVEATLKNFERFKKGSGELVQLIKDNNSSLNIQLVTKDNHTLNTKDLYFEPTLTKNGEDQILSMRLKSAENQYLEYKYVLKADDYMLDFEIQTQGLNNALVSSKPLNLEWDLKTYANEKSINYENRYAEVYFEYEDGKTDYLGLGSDKTDDPSKVSFIAYKQHFFSSILLTSTPFEKADLYSNNLVNDEEIDTIFTKQFKSKVPLAFKNGEIDQKMNWYFGPTDYKLLQSYDKNLESIVPLGWGIFGWINRHAFIPMYSLLSSFIEHGWAIVLFTILIKLLMSPVTYKSFLSQAKMKVLKPEITELGEKFKKDPMKKQQETMKLYNKAGVNPMAGCIPGLLQMPVFYALFQFFPSAIGLRQQSFLWADDLSSFDSVYALPFRIPGYGSHISLFPILASIAIFFYMKLTTGDQQMAQPQQEGMPDMAKMMKIMIYISPLMMLFFFNSYASGLSLYYFISNLISIGLLLVIKNYIVDEDKIHAQIQENKKKEPKKPSKFQQKLQEVMEQQEAMKAQQKKK
ncbi:membrane protein insertase YidC [Flavobacterium sp. NG2]|uniref:membrane protein insertase YidC n=1 Tax=Flavobacterium sp. NG2 TaxID=3097547 RepID=UPI002A80F71E|nr:membrane protein insertase YidC [Flavobacterium sp. NG2]WPR70416.1 membrane protein insertase YidC [Flavobacterium sp. NG2]